MDRTSEPTIQNVPQSLQINDDETVTQEKDIKSTNEYTSTPESNSSNESNEEKKNRFAIVRENGLVNFGWGMITYTPKRCRYDPDSPPEFSMMLNLLFAFVSYIYLA